MDLTVRERKVLAAMEHALTEEDPHLARQLARMRLTHRREARPAPRDETPAARPEAAEPKAEERAAEGPQVPKYVWDNPPGTVALRVSKWCAALTLVLLVASGLATSPEVLYAAAGTALVSLATCLTARSAARRA